ncbi:MAG: hypothetical protein WDN25_15290 [Acetobacteraceae bacterium]
MPEPRIRGDFAEKLRLTAAALHCTSRKDLCARFRAVNPATQCDLERLHKWIQGRALPRSTQLYDDWAKVLGTERSGTWLIACSVDDFRAEVSSLFGVSVDDLRQLDAARSRASPGTGKLSLLGGAMALCGSFACYSHAWSPHFRGHLIRGGMQISPSRGTGLLATYTESLLGRRVRLTGDINIAGRSMHCHMREPDSDLPLFFSMFLPGPPVSLLCGIMSGVAFVAHETLPSYSRVLMVRCPPEADLDASNRYMERGDLAISRDLARLGVAMGAPDRLDRLATEFLAENMDQVSLGDLVALSGLLDEARIERPTASL